MRDLYKVITTLIKITKEENLSVFAVASMLVVIESSSFFHLSESTHHKSCFLGAFPLANLQAVCCLLYLLLFVYIYICIYIYIFHELNEYERAHDHLIHYYDEWTTLLRIGRYTSILQATRIASIVLDSHICLHLCGLSILGPSSSRYFVCRIWST